MKKKTKTQNNTSSKKFRPYDAHFILEILCGSIDQIELSVRTANLLYKSGIHSIGELIQKTQQDLLRKGWGKKSIAEVIAVLADMGISLGTDLANLQFDLEENSVRDEFVAVGLFDDKLRLVSLHRDGRFVFLDEFDSYGGLYIVTSESLALKEAVDELETLINDPNTKEEALQDFFEKYPEFILNDEHKKAHPKVVLENREHKTLIPDFILEPYVQERMCDILDIKLPSTKVWVLKKNRPRFSSDVSDACAQLREYGHFFEEDENRLKVLDKYGLLAYRPKLFVIIGRRGRVDPITRRRIEGVIPNVSVLTYDDIVERMKQRIIMIGKRVRGHP